jgi:predicted component of type VI protein secretion system
VSRRHASIAPTENGYVLQDHSTNGVWVNGTRVQNSQLLARADVVRVGSEEFRFYADVAQGTPRSSSAQAPASSAAPAAAPAPPPRVQKPGDATAPVATVPAAVGASKAAGAAASPMKAEPSAPPPLTAKRPEPVSGGSVSRTPAKKPEPSTSPSGTTPPPPARARTVPRPVPKEEKRGIPTVVWLLLLLMVAVAAYFLGQGRG